ncbi:MAG TPA: ribulose-phosphate 3-epimerase [Anaerolineales bacterium]|nr:ribulose-phosphate 3-epimerase [Anaerolineales bacterium]
MDHPDTGFYLAPSILSADFGRLAEEIATVEAAGADWIHIDVMDGRFVPNLTMGPVVVSACRRATELPLDVHLMVHRPARFVEAFAAAGADRLTVHVEADPHLHSTLELIRSSGCRPGIALNPGTPVDLVRPLYPFVDLVLVMSVNPGFSGQAFIPATLSKVRQIRRELAGEHPDCLVEVDGGVAADTIGAAAQAGAQVFVAGSAVFGHPEGPAAGLAGLRLALDDAPAKMEA